MAIIPTKTVAGTCNTLSDFQLAENAVWKWYEKEILPRLTKKINEEASGYITDRHYDEIVVSNLIILNLLLVEQDTMCFTECWKQYISVAEVESYIKKLACWDIDLKCLLDETNIYYNDCLTTEQQAQILDVILEDPDSQLPSFRCDCQVEQIQNIVNNEYITNILQSISYAEYNGTATISVGGISAGDTFTSQTLQQMMDALISPFVSPTQTFSVSPSLIEKGTTSGSRLLTFAVTPNSDSVDNIELFLGSDLIDTPSAISGTFNDVQDLVFSSPSLSYTLRLLYGKTGLVNVVRNLTFVAPIYFGVGAAGLNETGIKALTKVLQTSRAKTINVSPNNQKIYYAVPEVLGRITSIIDQNNFQTRPGWTETQVTFTLADGVTTEVYNVYEIDNLTGTGVQVSYSFS